MFYRGSKQQLGRFGILPGCRASYSLEGSLFCFGCRRYAIFYPPPRSSPASQGREPNCKHAQGITEKENGHLRGRFAVFPSAEAGGCCGLFVVVVLTVDVAAVITLEGVAAAAFGCTEDTAPIVGAVGVTVFVSIFDGVE